MDRSAPSKEEARYCHGMANGTTPFTSRRARCISESSGSKMCLFWYISKHGYKSILPRLGVVGLAKTLSSIDTELHATRSINYVANLKCRNDCPSRPSMTLTEIFWTYLQPRCFDAYQHPTSLFKTSP